jgi:hypothetical protein
MLKRGLTVRSVVEAAGAMEVGKFKDELGALAIAPQPQR